MPLVDLRVSTAVLGHVLRLPGRFRIVGRDGQPLHLAETIVLQVEVDCAPRGAAQMEPVLQWDDTTGREILVGIVWRGRDAAVIATEDFDVDGTAIGGTVHQSTPMLRRDDQCAGLATTPRVSFGCPCPASQVEGAWVRRHRPHCVGPSVITIRSFAGGVLTEEGLWRALIGALGTPHPDRFRQLTDREHGLDPDGETGRSAVADEC